MSRHRLKISKSKRRRVMRRDLWLCTLRYDGCLGQATELHHIKPVSKGGDDTDDNLCSVCRSGRRHGAEPVATSRPRRPGRRAPVGPAHLPTPGRHRHARSRRGSRRRHVVVELAVEEPPVGFGGAAAPLLEEEGDIGGCALIAQIPNPRLLDRAVARAALSAGDEPVDPLEV
ncbi:MAG: HNH endonuclease [Gemmatimonadetes bacterium]|nr:HNH endonuclease [Gemmatimonadota bacterium]